MSDLPTNKQAQSAFSTVKSILSKATPIAESTIISAAPFLGAPVIKQIWEKFFEYLVSMITQALGDEAAFLVIDHQVSEETKAAISATIAYHSAQKNGDPNAITQAKQDFEKAAAALGTFDGTFH